MIRKIYLTAFGIGFAASSCFSPAQDALPVPGRQLFADAQVMQTSLERIRAGDSLTLRAFHALIQKADEALAEGPFSVMDKVSVPPSGDKHDYMSRGPYWWPDPEKTDGLPYIRRDGEVNPEKETITDHKYLGELIHLTEVLAKAWYFSGDKKYAAHAAFLIRTWFLDDSTRMNPNLNFGQAIPGRVDGRGIGIIETRELGRVLDAICLIQSSAHWTGVDEAGMQAWCRDYLSWLLRSKNGKEEAIHPNNHGTWYDVQAAALAIYTGQPYIAQKLAELAETRRLDAHIEADGSQPQEIARTRSWDYSCMNLWGLFQLARVAATVDEDLWHYPAGQASKLRQALDYLRPFALGEKPWPHEQITPYEANKILPHLRLAERIFPDGAYAEAAAKIRRHDLDPQDFAVLWE